MDLVLKYNHITFTLQYKMFVRILLKTAIKKLQIFKVHFFSFLSFLSPSSAPCKEESIRQPGVDTSYQQALLWRQAPLISAGGAVCIQYIYCVSTALPCIYHVSTARNHWPPQPLFTILNQQRGSGNVAWRVDTQQTRAYLARTERGRNEDEVDTDHFDINQLLYCHHSAIFLFN